MEGIRRGEPEAWGVDEVDEGEVSQGREVGEAMREVGDCEGHEVGEAVGVWGRLESERVWISRLLFDAMRASREVSSVAFVSPCEASKTRQSRSPSPLRSLRCERCPP